MILPAVVAAGVKSLLANKLRTFLAMLGIIIGVGAVIAMLAIGSGAQKQVLDRFAAMGTNILSVSPGQRSQHGVSTGTQQRLTLEDAQAIAREVPGVALVAPSVQGSGQLKYLNRNTRTSFFGTSATYFAIRDLKIDRGRIFSEGEAERMARVTVMGPTAAKNVFGDDDPVGQTVKVNGISFRVIGVTKPKGEGWMSPDDRIIVPYTTAMKQLLGLDYLRQIEIQAANEQELESVQAGIETLLRRRHRIEEGADSDFSVNNLADIRESATEVTGVFRTLLGGIAAISLVVGGIGIMNIMLVTVTERTREIGIRKAIGATEGHILAQFLAESVIISLAGGLLGLGAGVGTARIISGMGTFTTVVEWSSAVMAIGVAASVGIFFGFYPAWRAARLDPIEALRYE